MRTCLTAAILGLGLVGGASAQSYGYSNYGYGQSNYGNQGYNAPVDYCAKQTRDRRTGGAIVGGLIGALAGGAIGNNIDDDNDHRYRRGFRGYRGYGGQYYRNRRDDSSGKVAAGAVIGGLLGAVAGSEVGRRNVNCQPYHDSVNRNYQYAPNVPAPTRYPAPQPISTYPATAPRTVYRSSQPTTITRTVRTYPAPTPAPQPRVYRDDDLYGGRQQCETLTRVTRLPDGREIREDVQDCAQGEVYYERNGRRVQGGF